MLPFWVIIFIIQAVHYLGFIFLEKMKLRNSHTFVVTFPDSRTLTSNPGNNSAAGIAIYRLLMFEGMILFEEN